MVYTNNTIIKEYIELIKANGVSNELFQAGSFFYSVLFEKESIAKTPDLLNVIKEIRQNPILTGVNIAMIHKFHEQLLVSANERYKNISDIACYSGEFPTNSLNAECRQTNNGYLFLINSGAIFLLREASNIISCFCVANPGKEGEKKAWNCEDSGYSEKALVLFFTNLVISYLALDFKGRPSSAKIAHLERLEISSLVWSFSVKFLLAHEFSHAICDHFSNIGDASNEAGFIKKNWDQEFEADRNALNILLGNIDNIEKNLDEFNRKLLEECIVCSVLFLFELENLLAEILKDSIIESILGKTLGKISPIYFTHPPSIIRQEKILNVIKSEYKHIDLRLSTSYMNTVRLFKDKIIINVRDFLERSLKERNMDS